MPDSLSGLASTDLGALLANAALGVNGLSAINEVATAGSLE
jgi:hypothetical protein